MLAPGHEEIFEQASRRKRAKSASKSATESSDHDGHETTKRRRRSRSESSKSSGSGASGGRRRRKSSACSDGGNAEGKSDEDEGMLWNAGNAPSPFGWRANGDGAAAKPNEFETSTPLRPPATLQAEITSSMRAIKMELPESPPESAKDSNEISLDVFEELLRDEEMQLYWNNDDACALDDEAVSQFAEGLLGSDLMLSSVSAGVTPLASHLLPVGMCRPCDLPPLQPSNPMTVACPLATPM